MIAAKEGKVNHALPCSPSDAQGETWLWIILHTIYSISAHFFSFLPLSAPFLSLSLAHSLLTIGKPNPKMSKKGNYAKAWTNMSTISRQPLLTFNSMSSPWFPLKPGSLESPQCRALVMGLRTSHSVTELHRCCHLCTLSLSQYSLWWKSLLLTQLRGFVFNPLVFSA